MPDKYDLSEFADDLENKLVQAANDIALVIAQNSADYAPKGWSGQLKRSIKAQKAIKKKDRIYARVTAYAADRLGSNYALKQHDEKLNHVHTHGSRMTRGFQDYGEGPTGEIKYWSGYHRLIKEKKTFKHATEFFIMGFNASKREIDLIVNKI